MRVYKEEVALESERAWYEAHRSDLLQHHEGQYALIHEDRLLGTFSSLEEAFDAGVAALGTEPFLLQHVTREAEIVYFPALNAGMISANSPPLAEGPAR